VFDRDVRSTDYSIELIDFIRVDFSLDYYYYYYYYYYY
jgi:hypothetical protein